MKSTAVACFLLVYCFHSSSCASAPVVGRQERSPAESLFWGRSPGGELTRAVYNIRVGDAEGRLVYDALDVQNPGEDSALWEWAVMAHWMDVAEGDGAWADWRVPLWGGLSLGELEVSGSGSGSAPYFAMVIEGGPEMLLAAGEDWDLFGYASGSFGFGIRGSSSGDDGGMSSVGTEVGVRGSIGPLLFKGCAVSRQVRVDGAVGDYWNEPEPDLDSNFEGFLISVGFAF